ncbi:hypothetical protein ABZ474_57075, partial [Streptomyces mirabilis]
MRVPTPPGGAEPLTPPPWGPAPGAGRVRVRRIRTAARQGRRRAREAGAAAVGGLKRNPLGSGGGPAAAELVEAAKSLRTLDLV